MKRSWLIMALAAGVLSAVAFLGVTAPSLVSIVMFYLSPAPLFMVGIAFGAPAALVGAAAGFVFLAVVLNLKAAAFHLVSIAIAPAVISRLAMTSRAAGAGAAEGEAADAAGREWYPEGRLLLWTAFMGAVLMSALMLMIGPDMAAIQTHLGLMAGQILKLTGAAAQMNPVEARAMKTFLVAVTPLVSTALWLLSMMGDFFLAAKALSAFGYETRPWAPFRRLAFHPRASVALALASFASFLPGVFGLAGQIFAISFMTAFAILGLAVVHALLKDSPWRPWLLGALYAGLFFLNWLLAMPLVVLALADMSFGVRAKYAASHGGPPAKT